jgi:hypothetical protein
MDFSYFEKLSKKDAELYLEHFLLEVNEGFNKLLPDFEKEQIIIDYSIESIVPVINWVKLNLKTIPKMEDKNLPSWITESEVYKKGLYTFDEISRILILRVSYYFGECFVRSNKKLTWNIGNAKTAECNMPVVTGFKKKLELAPILICENLIRRLVQGADLTIINTALEYWKADI